MSTEQEAWPPKAEVPTKMLPVDYVGLKEAFTEWWNQGCEAPPSNGEIVMYDKIDTEILQHLATFIWKRAQKAQQ
jgi:hypothetical protein